MTRGLSPERSWILTIELASELSKSQVQKYQRTTIVPQPLTYPRRAFANYTNCMKCTEGDNFYSVIWFQVQYLCRGNWCWLLFRFWLIATFGDSGIGCLLNRNTRFPNKNHSGNIWNHLSLFSLTQAKNVDIKTLKILLMLSRVRF